MLEKHYDRRTSAVRAMALIGNGVLIGTSNAHGTAKSLPASAVPATKQAIDILKASTAETWEADRDRALDLLYTA